MQLDMVGLARLASRQHAREGAGPSVSLAADAIRLSSQLFPHGTAFQLQRNRPFVAGLPSVTFWGGPAKAGSGLEGKATRLDPATAKVRIEQERHRSGRCDFDRL